MGARGLRYALGRSVAGPPDALATLRFADRRALLGLLVDPDVHFGEAYSDGRIEVEGDLLAALEAAYRAFEGRGASAAGWLSLLARHTPRRSRSNVHRHYDLGNDFYAQWLDQSLVYTCAYFESPEQGLDEAQAAKLELVCRKLALRPGERVVEAGCGWGALALHMAAPPRRAGHAPATSRESSWPGPARARPSGDWRAASSSSRPTTAGSRAASTPSCRWGCSSTSACAPSASSPR